MPSLVLHSLNRFRGIKRWKSTLWLRCQTTLREGLLDVDIANAGVLTTSTKGSRKNAGVGVSVTLLELAYKYLWPILKALKTAFLVSERRYWCLPWIRPKLGRYGCGGSNADNARIGSSHWQYVQGGSATADSNGWRAQCWILAKNRYRKVRYIFIHCKLPLTYIKHWLRQAVDYISLFQPNLHLALITRLRRSTKY